MSYRQRQITVDAKQWWPPGDDRHDPAMLSDRKGNAVSPPDFRRPWDIYRFDRTMDIYFLRGATINDHTKLNPGDYVVTDASGGKHALSPKDFEARYEPVSQPITDPTR